MQLSRRILLCGSAVAATLSATANAAILRGGLPWTPYAGSPPQPVGPGEWHFFTAEEGRTVEALVDRLIPPDPDTPGGKDAGCATFIDRQLAGAYGSSAALYMRPPFREGTKSQGNQSPLTPAQRYRRSLADLAAHCRAAYAGKSFDQLPGAEQDRLIHRIESGELQLDHTSGRGFFEILIKDTQHGFLADPVYGGNRGMCAWKMIGFPGARYDYREWIERHNERFPLPPVAIGGGRPDWTPATR